MTILAALILGLLEVAYVGAQSNAPTGAPFPQILTLPPAEDELPTVTIPPSQPSSSIDPTDPAGGGDLTQSGLTIPPSADTYITTFIPTPVPTAAPVEVTSTGCVCGAGTSCCTFDQACFEGTCVARTGCPTPTVLDARSAEDSQCLSVEPCNGLLIEHCVQCNPGGGCFRCQNNFKLEYDRQSCVESCANGDSQFDVIVLSPVIRIVCAAPEGQVSASDPPTLQGTDAPSTSTPTLVPSSRAPTDSGETFSPTARPTSNAPSEPPSSSPSTGAPTRTPTTIQPTKSPSTPSPTRASRAAISSDDGMDTQWIIIGALAGITVLLTAIVMIYICRERMNCRNCCGCLICCRPKEKEPAPELVEMGSMRSKKPIMSLDDNGGGASGTADDSMVLNPTLSGTSGGPDKEKEPEYLTGPEETEFFEWLSGLKKHKATFSILLKEMTTRRDNQTTVAEREKYEKVVKDLERILFLFKAKKDQRRAPQDGMQLLDWAQNTVDRFNSGA